MTKYVGVIGYPAQQSLSAVFQQAAFSHLGLDLRYEVWATPAERLAEVVQGLRAPDRLGANVTIPHKEAVLPLMDETDEVARRVAAVNTIVNRQGRLHGHNTDVGGFLRALREDGGFDPAGRRAVIAGAGGAARAVAVALCEAGARTVTVMNRTPDRAAKLVSDLREAAGHTVLDSLPAEGAAWWSALGGGDLLVNCTSVGSAGSAEESESPVPVDVIHPGLLIYDLIYRPAETLLMATARARGAQVLGGLPMLIYQGAESFRIWTGLEAPIDIMFAAARKALAEEAR